MSAGDTAPRGVRSTPDDTAVRVALWRALHVELDAPHVLDDPLGLALVAPPPGWRGRPDMDPVRTSRSRASIVARARFVEDLLGAERLRGVTQYVMLGAGLDTFAHRARATERLRVFEVDRPETQAWKELRLQELGWDVPAGLRFVPVDFEAGDAWTARLVEAGFDPAERAVVSVAGVSMYLTRAANEALLRDAAALARGSTVVVSFLVPMDQVEPAERPAIEGAARGARANGTPWVSVFAPDELVGMARSAGFDPVHHVSGAELARLYFADRADGLRPSSAEALVVATR
ncbi:MAG: class I SAM-dependent methyltransferase [Myxococcota bacterium]